MHKVAIFISDSNGCYPVPASKGGAVSTLVEHLIEQNEKKHLMDMECISYYDDEAFDLARNYPSIKFTWVKVPSFVKTIDKILFWCVSKLTHKKANSFLSLFSLVFYILKSAMLLRKNVYDSIVLEHNIPMAWMIRISGYKGRFFYHLHNTPRVNAKCKSVFSRCDGFMCVSNYMAKEIESETNPIGPVELNRVHVLYNCIDVELFRPLRREETKISQQDYGISSSSKVVVFAGRITWEKGIDKLLEALNYIESPDVSVLIVGSWMMGIENRDKYAEELEALATKHKNKVFFTGYIPHHDIPQIYNLADVAVLPSMWEEPAGLTMIEAMACGTPVITTSSGGIPEYVGDCAIVLNRDEELPMQIARYIDKLCNDEKLWNECSKRGMAHIKTHFATNTYLENFYKIISK